MRSSMDWQFQVVITQYTWSGAENTWVTVLFYYTSILFLACLTLLEYGTWYVFDNNNLFHLTKLAFLLANARLD